MRRRLDIAASFILSPPVLFLDEPTARLDPRGRNQAWEAIRALAVGGTSVLLTTQYLDEADQLAGKISVIDHGQVIAHGSPNSSSPRSVVTSSRSCCTAPTGCPPPPSSSAEWPVRPSGRPRHSADHCAGTGRCWQWDCCCCCGSPAVGRRLSGAGRQEPGGRGRGAGPGVAAGVLSNPFVAPATMPGWLATIVEWNPLSATVAATRELFANPGVGWPLLDRPARAADDSGLAAADPRGLPPPFGATLPTAQPLIRCLHLCR
jgi:hypothetical protein